MQFSAPLIIRILQNLEDSKFVSILKILRICQTDPTQASPGLLSQGLKSVCEKVLAKFKMDYT